jgi:NAD(P)-dependent dehydrogenase (short-subunit alcohol dehydrogenase family)
MNTNTNKIALVTGATRGIGLETVRQLAETGVHVLLAGRNRDKAVEAALQLQRQGLLVEAIALDVTDSASIVAAAKEIEQRHGKLDILSTTPGSWSMMPRKASPGSRSPPGAPPSTPTCLA